jgi:hypothetical protein
VITLRKLQALLSSLLQLLRRVVAFLSGFWTRADSTSTADKMAWTIALSDADISTLTTAYTMAAGSEGRMSASFTNRNTSASATVQLWVVPSGETRGNEHLKEAGTTLGFAGTPQANLERFFVVPAGAVVFVQASTANVSCQVQGDVVTPNSDITVDGTPSYGANWAVLSSQATLKKTNNSKVFFDFVVYAASPSPATSPITFPSGFRPTTNSRVFIGMMSFAGTYYPIYFQVDPSGLCSYDALPTSLSLTPTTNDTLYITGEFYI